MFCPEAYTPLAALWDQFCDRRLRSFYESSARYYASEEFEPYFVRGSPLDICEHTFLKSASQCGLHVSSPDGQIMRLHAPLHDGRASLLSVRAVGPSVYEWAAHELETDSQPGMQTADAWLFMPWHGEEDDPRDWREAYPPLADDRPRTWRLVEDRLRFHCLPLCVERPSYTIVTELPGWSRTIRSTGELGQLVTHFAGWAVCMSDAAMSDWQAYLDGQSLYDDSFEVQENEPTAGRPSRKADALRDYRITFPDGHEVAWKIVPSKIEATTGNVYSETTIRRALKEQDQG